ncbi:hypothetical protein D3C81_918140 [compost metagenome]
MPNPPLAAAIAPSLLVTVKRGFMRTSVGSSVTPKRQPARGDRLVVPITACSARSDGCFGTPWRARYSGEAHSMRRTLPTRSALSPESGKGPIRTATSMPSSTMLTMRSRK